MAINYVQDVIRKPIAWPFELEDMNGKSGNLSATFWDVVTSEGGGLIGVSYSNTYATDLTPDPDTDKMAQVTLNVSTDTGTALITATTVDEIPPGMNFYFWTYLRPQPNGSLTELTSEIQLIGTGTTDVHTLTRLNSGVSGQKDPGVIKGLVCGFYAGNNQWRVYGPDIAGSLVTGDTGLKVRTRCFYDNNSNESGIAHAAVGNINYGN